MTMPEGLKVTMQGPKANEVDLALLRSASLGDVNAFENLFKRYFRRLAGFAARITSSNELAEEVAAETMMAVWRGAARFEGRSKVSTWIFGIAYRQALRVRKRL